MNLKVNGLITNDDDAPVYRDWFGMSATSPSDIIDQLPTTGEDVTVEVASDGGEVDAATQIAGALQQYKGQVNVQILSNAYSAGTIVAMGGNKVQMAAGAKMMIHNSAAGADGDYHDMNNASEMLQKTNQSIAAMYAEKTGKPASDFLALMDKTTWLTADDAIELGLADEKINSNPVTATNSVNKLVPVNAINKLKGLIAENKKLKQINESQPSEHEKLVQAKLALLNKGDF
ncbi:Clp protease ClpP [Oenococcus oeni]|uniref:head maturation protease, ClpP-related n=1 Tax=Oenococcus oeni TaxID=1247 RepID=UPI00051076E8|nr:head maturation protease, ClpP-related [Oenococcus oeni]KGH55228.1 protease [Oenococcus oeni S22]KGH98041.1 protease [Oenococcus oeni IOEB_1491]OIL71152.1 protease [Oenococcus oeni]OIL96410.1 protease [Oenococcus oeni]OIM03279.1 protease [Oenococcus oeni]